MTDIVERLHDRACVEDLIANLQRLGDGEIDDLSVAHDALTEIVDLRLANAALRAENEALFSLLPTDARYMDPPDGGDVSRVEQMRRMIEALRNDAEHWRERRAILHEGLTIELQHKDGDRLLTLREHIALLLLQRSKAPEVAITTVFKLMLQELGAAISRGERSE